MARHIYNCPLRWSDMDAFGHVNNVVFLRYLEEARIDFMFRLAPGTVRRPSRAAPSWPGTRSTTYGRWSTGTSR